MLLCFSVDSTDTSRRSSQSTLRSLHLPFCTGTTSPVNAQDEELGAELILSPERCRRLPRNACWIRPTACGDVQSKPEQVGWVHPQEGALHILVGCVRRVEEPEPEPACPLAYAKDDLFVHKTVTIN